MRHSLSIETSVVSDDTPTRARAHSASSSEEQTQGLSSQERGRNGSASPYVETRPSSAETSTWSSTRETSTADQQSTRVMPYAAPSQARKGYLSTARRSIAMSDSATSTSTKPPEEDRSKSASPPPRRDFLSASRRQSSTQESSEQKRPDSSH